MGNYLTIKLEAGAVMEGCLMIILKIILITVGVALIMFGYEIYFKNGRKTESYAKKVGLIEFVLGIVLALIGICVIIIRK